MDTSLTRAQQAQASQCSRLHFGRVSQKHLPYRILAGVMLAGFLTAQPGCHEAMAAQPPHALGQTVDGVVAGALPVSTGAGNLAVQPASNWLSQVIEFFTPGQTKGLPVAKKQAQKKCQNGDCGVLEEFIEFHPVASNLLYACLTFAAGWYMSGGRMPFARLLRGSKGGAA